MWSECTVILWKPAIDIVVEHAEDEWQAEKAAAPISFLEFPDGSMQIEDQAPAERVWWLLSRIDRRSVEKGPPYQIFFYRNTIFDSLAPFPRMAFNLVGPIGYFEQCDEIGPVVGSSGKLAEAPGESNLHSLDVVAAFERRPRKAVQAEFRSHLSAWAESVVHQGCFGDGPIVLVSEVEFPGRRAYFRVDASRSGQRTINWLTLSLLNFGIRVQPVSGIFYGRGPEGRAIGPQPDLARGREIAEEWMRKRRDTGELE